MLWLLYITWRRLKITNNNNNDDEYDRADDYLESQDDYIYFETDKHFKDMTKQQKIQAVDRIFYANRGLFNHEEAAKALLAGIETRHNPLFQGEKITIWNRKTKTGSIQMIRGSNGRFKGKVK